MCCAPVNFDVKAWVMTRYLVSTLLALLCGIAQGGECRRPVAGNFAGSCEALGSMLIARGHPADAWIGCEESRGSAGYGVAVFFAEEVRPFWDQEILTYLSSLKSRHTGAEYRRVALEHGVWLKNRPRLEREALKEVRRQGGTLGMLLWEMKMAEVARHRALTLGCFLEEEDAKSVPPRTP